MSWLLRQPPVCVFANGRVVAFVGTHKPTYLFGDLAPLESAADLLTVSELYLDSENGMVPAYKLPAQTTFSPNCSDSPGHDE